MTGGQRAEEEEETKDKRLEGAKGEEGWAESLRSGDRGFMEIKVLNAQDGCGSEVKRPRRGSISSRDI